MAKGDGAPVSFEGEAGAWWHSGREEPGESALSLPPHWGKTGGRGGASITFHPGEVQRRLQVGWP